MAAPRSQRRVARPSVHTPTATSGSERANSEMPRRNRPSSRPLPSSWMREPPGTPTVGSRKHLMPRVTYRGGQRSGHQSRFGPSPSGTRSASPEAYLSAQEVLHQTRCSISHGVFQRVGAITQARGLFREIGDLGLCALGVSEYRDASHIGICEMWDRRPVAVADHHGSAQLRVPESYEEVSSPDAIWRGNQTDQVVGGKDAFMPFRQQGDSAIQPVQLPRARHHDPSLVKHELLRVIDEPGVDAFRDRGVEFEEFFGAPIGGAVFTEESLESSG